ncbi:hypothetical protein GCM10011391_21120 [Pullulanibacillus camelliae]|uniref:Flagellar hook-basal body complex protein FliE n=1 Tax=Pullulanibacillus camelliae TaxID=1707096 RepID=A0A8J2YH97_9BACL|nr:flagellar hook-basal body complex protein FliE [Pullulanibacillus camelliae]GGE42104.1 hypothetical protein GCM10011391_21120 [Pullulanibacillus camelliae]
MVAPVNLLSTSSVGTPNLNTATGSNSVSSVSKSFSNVLNDALDKVNGAENGSEQAVSQLVNGTADNLHDVTIAMEKSEIMLKLAVQVRDKAVSAYQDIMRMQV